MDKPLWIVSYDIACPKRLRRVYKLCGELGWALQKSVFVLALTKAERLQFCAKVKKLLQPEQDRLLCLPFCPNEASFHWGEQGEASWLFVHDDPRLQGYVF